MQMRTMRKTFSMTLTALAVGLLFTPMAHAALRITDATLTGGTVTISGNMAAKQKTVTWEGNPVTSTNSGGSFYFTTIVVPLDCIGTVSDGVTTLDVTIAGCTPVPPPPTTAFPATGQTTCWDSSATVITCTGTGQDGEIQAGADLSYTDNGDGTITDNNTGLMWEKQSDDGTIHDKDNTYTWANAFAVHIAGLNAAAFGGHTDWRLPNVKELQSIVNYQNFNPMVSPAFNTACAASSTVTSGSCTAASGYWTSSSYVGLPAFAFDVFFNVGFVNANFKDDNHSVRAVRGGL